jgi:type IV pilus assembly protein PilV
MSSFRILPQTRIAKLASGFSLIEVLIALIIMSVGMLGIAGLYVHGMQAGRTSMFRHHAVTLAGDVADRIRANPTAGVAYIDAGTAPAPGVNCIGGGIDCTPAEMADSDMFFWDQQADATLPNGDVTVAYNNAAVPSVYTVTVSWEEAGQDPPTYVISFPVFEML